eukprot:TRINITY_DN14372_c0_g1_i1.p1 TRINITY_DN14372_c0_g1~~TRINITY_DN14372_c0_g1_i1.p1  ORF type:complete len:522 (+),score=12.12 TRINITY_DN14372_c0_g1_i1:34-1599(+)
MIELAAPLTAGQLGFFFGYTVIVLLWAYSCWLRSKTKVIESPKSCNNVDITITDEPAPETVQLFTRNNPLIKALSLDTSVIIEHHAALQSMTEFGAHLLFYFLCDRTSIMQSSGKSYSRDVFWFIYLLLVIYNFAMCIRELPAAAYLNRDQTEEWKGWMQVLFLMYHYFQASEQYSSIRIYIAAYVWMTGFGNFSFYYIRKDFSVSRFVQMLWRLNFLVFWVCVVMGNSYMLYYICPMHTLWTIAVYLVLLVGSHLNGNNIVLFVKILVSFALVFGMFASKEAFYTMWNPVLPLVGYVNPSKPDVHPLHEWFFRAGLDRYIWIFGMLCANFHPNTESALVWVDNLPSLMRFVVRAAVVTVLLSIGYFWYESVFTLPKYEYNALHPFTSWVPILIFIILRNLTPTLRRHSLCLFSWLGKITLETYIGQFHIWLHTGVADAQPGTLMTVVEGYPLLNFMVTTPVYIFVSYRLFVLTNSLKSHILPSDNHILLYRNLLLVGLGWVACYIVGFCGQTFLQKQVMS